jgi:hypothetical protein
MEANDQILAQAALSPSKESPVPLGLVGPRSGLDTCGRHKDKSPWACWESNPGDSASSQPL